MFFEMIRKALRSCIPIIVKITLKYRRLKFSFMEKNASAAYKLQFEYLRWSLDFLPFTFCHTLIYF